MMTPRGRLAAVLVAAIVGLAACSGSPSPSPVSSVIRVLGSWEGPEIDAFRAAVKPFEERTGYSVVVSTTRDLKGALERSFEVGDPPDLAGLPGPGYMLELVRQGKLVNLADVIDTGTYLAETAPGFVDIGTVEGKLTGVFMKATVKGLFWYDPEVIQPGDPETWDDLQHDAVTGYGGIAPWCIGLASDASSGWPGTDWVEDFVLRQSGPQVYDDWVAGRIRWSSPEIRRAFRSFGTVIDDADGRGRGRGGPAHALQPCRRWALHRPAQVPVRPPGHLHVHLPRRGRWRSTAVATTSSRSRTSSRASAEPSSLPGTCSRCRTTRPRAVTSSATSSARRPSSSSSSMAGALSGNLRVTDYPNDLARRQAELLASATILRFDASDSMPDVMNEAFWQAILDFTADESQLDRILAQLDAVQAVAYKQE